MLLKTNILSDFPVVFADDPIVITAETSTADIPNDAVLSSVIVKVNCNGSEHLFPMQFLGNDTVFVDISSAFRAEYIRIDMENPPTPQDRGYTPIHASIKAMVQYLLNGKLYQETEQLVFPTSENGRTLSVLRGGLSEKGRRKAKNPSAAVASHKDRLSMKPDGIETRMPTEQVLNSRYDLTEDMVTTNQTDATLASNVMVDSKARRMEFVFRNSLGVMETVSASCMDERIGSVTTEQLAAIIKPSYESSRMLINRSQRNPDVLKMSSGYVAEEWADWWIHEFLTAKYCWMKLKEKDTEYFVPVYLEANKQDNTLHRLNEPFIPEITFNVTMAS